MYQKCLTCSLFVGSCVSSLFEVNQDGNQVEGVSLHQFIGDMDCTYCLSANSKVVGVELNLF